MRKARFFAFVTIVTILTASAALHAQKPIKPSYPHVSGTTSSPSLPHRSDKSALVLNQKARGGAAEDLNRIEQQSLRASAPATQPARVRPAYALKPRVTKGNQNVPINFSGHASSRTATVTKASGRASSLSVPKPH